MRYQNIFTGEKVTKISEDHHELFEQPCVNYRRDNPVSNEFGYRLKDFIKPLYVFNQCYKPIENEKTTTVIAPVAKRHSTWL